MTSFSVQMHWCVNLLSHFFHFSYASSRAPIGQAPPCFCSQSAQAWLHSLIRTLVTFGQAQAREHSPSPALQRLMSLSCTLHLKKLCCMMGNSPLRLWGPSTITDLKQTTVSLRARMPSPRKAGHRVKLLAFIFPPAIAL